LRVARPENHASPTDAPSDRLRLDEPQPRSIECGEEPRWPVTFTPDRRALLGFSAEEVRGRYVLGTLKQVVAGLRQQVAWGVTHLIVSHGAQRSSLWSDQTLELFASEVMPAFKPMKAAAD